MAGLVVAGVVTLVLVVFLADAGEHRQIESVEDDLRLVVGSPSTPILEEQT